MGLLDIGKKYKQYKGEKVTYEDDNIRVHASKKSYDASVRRRFGKKI